MGLSTADTIIELIDKGEGRVGAIFFGMREEDVEFALTRPWTTIGSDGAALALRTDHQGFAAERINGVSPGRPDARHRSTTSCSRAWATTAADATLTAVLESIARTG